MTRLLTKTAEFALDVLETDGVLLPFCNLIDRSGAPVHITPSGPGEHAGESVRVELARRLDRGEVSEFAVCSDVDVMFENEATEQRCLKIELQDGTERSGVYYFRLVLQDGRASLGSYILAPPPTGKL
jgi:hypothetical protein